MPYTREKVSSLILELRKLQHEVPWVEFKSNNFTPDLIGENISALSNAAALHDRSHAYLVWGIDDETHDLIGTDFDPQEMKKGNQSLDLWLSTLIKPQTQFYFHSLTIDAKKVVLLEIHRASHMPVKFKEVEYIRIDSNKKKLKDYPDIEKELWQIFSRITFEKMVAMEGLTDDRVIKLLDYPSYFDLLSLDLPEGKRGIMEALINEGMVTNCETGGYNITNLGAILFAKKLSDFPYLSRKAIRVIVYHGKDRTISSYEQIGSKGYASGFEALIAFINQILPKNEVIGKALRKEVPMYPELAVRELVANAIVHQDFSMQGVGPMIEIFEGRVEITNPGNPLIDKQRFVDHPPISRNETLASFMRRIGVCEERGSGFDKVIAQTEFYQLPAPEIDIFDNHTRVTLFAHMRFADMSKEDRIRACYLHACLKRVNREYVTNSSLRERFNIKEKNSSMVSRLLKQTLESGLIKLADETASDKNKKYLPYWA
jgi:ATP-dependent DNA helicase RecG